MTTYRRREIGDAVRAALATMPVVGGTGLRQAGKSTFLQHEPGLAGRSYASLDEFAQLEAARRHPEGFVRVDRPLTETRPGRKCVNTRPDPISL